MHWIPYKEGDTDIPEGVQLLVQRTLTLFNSVPWYQVARFSKDLFKVDDIDFFDRKGVSGFYEYDSEWGYLTVNDIVAYAVIDEYKPALEEKEEK